MILPREAARPAGCRLVELDRMIDRRRQGHLGGTHDAQRRRLWHIPRHRSCSRRKNDPPHAAGDAGAASCQPLGAGRDTGELVGDDASVRAESRAVDRRPATTSDIGAGEPAVSASSVIVLDGEGGLRESPTRPFHRASYQRGAVARPARPCRLPRQASVRRPSPSLHRRLKREPERCHEGLRKGFLRAGRQGLSEPVPHSGKPTATDHAGPQPYSVPVVGGTVALTTRRLTSRINTPVRSRLSAKLSVATMMMDIIGPPNP